MRLVDENYPRKHEEVKEEGYDEACKQNPHFGPTEGFFHRTVTWFNDGFYEFSAEGRCACGSTFWVRDVGPETIEGCEVRITLNTRFTPACPAVTRAAERAVVKVRENLGRPKLCGMCCGATVRGDGKTTGWGRQEGKVCRVCDGTGREPAWKKREPVLSRFNGDVARLRDHVIDLVDEIVSNLDAAHAIEKRSGKWWGPQTASVLGGIVLRLRREVFEARVGVERARADVKAGESGRPG